MPFVGLPMMFFASFSYLADVFFLSFSIHANLSFAYHTDAECLGGRCQWRVTLWQSSMILLYFRSFVQIRDSIQWVNGDSPNRIVFLDILIFQEGKVFERAPIGIIQMLAVKEVYAWAHSSTLKDTCLSFVVYT